MTSDIRDRAADHIAATLHDMWSCPQCRPGRPCVERADVAVDAAIMLDALVERPELVSELALIVATGQYRPTDPAAPVAYMPTARPAIDDQCAGCGATPTQCQAGDGPCCGQCPRVADGPVVIPDDGPCACGGAVATIPGSRVRAVHGPTTCRTVPLFRPDGVERPTDPCPDCGEPNGGCDVECADPTCDPAYARSCNNHDACTQPEDAAAAVATDRAAAAVRLVAARSGLPAPERPDPARRWPVMGH